MAQVTGAIEIREGLSVTDFGRVSATLRHFGSSRTAEVLARLGLSEHRWSAAQTAWNRAIEEDAEGDGEQLTAWNEAFDATKQDLDARKPDVDGIAPLELAEAPAKGAPEIDALPHAPAKAEPPPLVPPPLVSAPSEDAPSPWAAGSEGRKRAPAMTQRLDPAAAPRPATLPFKAKDPASEPKEQRPSVPRIPVSTGTTDVDERMLLQTILPFGLPALPAGAPKADPLPALSPSPAPAGPYTTLTLEQYASLLAELATSPDKSREIRARYHVQSDMLIGALHASWHERLRDDPALMERFQGLYARYRAWLVQSTR